MYGLFSFGALLYTCVIYTANIKVCPLQMLHYHSTEIDCYSSTFQKNLLSAKFN